ncbi:hypothetical protein AgCh_035916 [Apium graveolens]
MVAMARSLLKELDTPSYIWGEAVRHSVYLLNRLPTRALTDVTPYEAWSKKKPQIEYLSVFGCIAHMKLSNVHVKKLDDRSNGRALRERTRDESIPSIRSKHKNYTCRTEISGNGGSSDADFVESYIESAESDSGTPNPHSGSYSGTGTSNSQQISTSEQMSEDSRAASVSSDSNNSSDQLNSEDLDTSGNIIKHKAHLVAKGYVQRCGIDYEEVLTPVTSLETVRLLIALAVKNEWEIHHLDVKTTFLNGELQEEVYVNKPKSYVIEGHDKKVYRLFKALYGLRQAPGACDLAGNLDDRKSTGGLVFYLDESLITWVSQKQRSAIDLAKNPIFHGLSKHIDVRYHFIRECVEKGSIIIKHIGTNEQRADVLTKPMSITKFEKMRKLLGVKNLEHGECEVVRLRASAQEYIKRYVYYYERYSRGSCITIAEAVDPDRFSYLVIMKYVKDNLGVVDKAIEPASQTQPHVIQINKKRKRRSDNEKKIASELTEKKNATEKENNNASDNELQQKKNPSEKEMPIQIDQGCRLLIEEKGQSRRKSQRNKKAETGGEGGPLLTWQVPHVGPTLLTWQGAYKPGRWVPYVGPTMLTLMWQVGHTWAPHADVAGNLLTWQWDPADVAGGPQ